MGLIESINITGHYLVMYVFISMIFDIWRYTRGETKPTRPAIIHIAIPATTLFLMYYFLL